MKISLAWCVYNKRDTIANVLESWLSRLSGLHTYEAVVVCDACVDGTQEIARETLAKFTPPLSRWSVIDTPDVYEIAANNKALEWAADDSDLICFIQDDNWMYSSYWDNVLVGARLQVMRPGCTAMLAGGIFDPDGVHYQRVEAPAPHKGQYFADKGIMMGNLRYDPDPGLYLVDFITRPFAVRTRLLREMGGLGAPGFDVICWDDTDLSIKLLKADYVNQYLALDVLNTCGGQHTMKERMAESFKHNQRIFLDTHSAWLAQRTQSPFRKLCDLVVFEESEGANFVYPAHNL